jgi:hypothetical protein
MNKFLQNLFLVIFPFYPLWSWLCLVGIHKPFDFVVDILLIPFAIYFIVFKYRKLPPYLLCLILFTTYHLVAVFINDTVPKDSNAVYFILADANVFACILFIVIEYTHFEEWFIKIMSRNILFIILISLVVSVIQIKNPLFFFNAALDPEGKNVLEENRLSSIYSWISLNSAGITFPILIAIALSVYQAKKSVVPFIVICGIVVSFLTKARYVMISALIALSQLFFNRNKPVSKRITSLVLLVSGVVLIGLTAQRFGYDINDVINKRILEKESDMASAKARVLSYEVFLIVFPQNPWFGVGPETKADVVEMLQGEAPTIHVGYLAYLYFYGILGSIFLFLSIFYLLRDAWIAGKRFNYWGSFYGLISFVLANTSFVYFNLSELGIVLAVIYIKYYITDYAEDWQTSGAQEEHTLLVGDIPVTHE